jgi:hypothetical protein
MPVGPATAQLFAGGYMNRSFRKLTYAAAIAVVALTLSPMFALAQKIYVVEGGRTTLTLSKAFLADLTKIGAVPTAVAGSQLYENQINFPITSGAISLESAAGEMLHAGGINLTLGTKLVKLNSFLINTIGEESYVTGLVVVNGKFLGRIKLFDLTLPSDLSLPLDPKSGDFFLGGVQWNLDPEGAVALNDAFGTKVFTDNLFIGDSLSLAFVPLNADGQ